MAKESEFRVTVPKFDNSGNPISDKAISQIAREMSDNFGGVTITPSVLGCWWDNENNKLACENNLILSSVRDCESHEPPLDSLACRRKIEQDRVFIEGLAERVGRDFGQASIMLAEDTLQDVDFVKAKWKPTVKRDLRRDWGQTDWFEKMV